jgi:hypothetical protein
MFCENGGCAGIFFSIKKTALWRFYCNESNLKNCETISSTSVIKCANLIVCKNGGGARYIFNIQGVSEIGTLILTGNRTRQKEQLFYLSFCRKTMFNSKKKLERFFTKIALRH